ncbi:MAG: hypothetical protein H6658_03870 [Ardenticatenaceae bacterium]|nr:hypothetical protein [Ardenticatenaceae bacterium]
MSSPYRSVGLTATAASHHLSPPIRPFLPHQQHHLARRLPIGEHVHGFGHLL